MLIPEKTLKAINTENFKLIGQILQEILFLKVSKRRFGEKLIEKWNTKFNVFHSNYVALKSCISMKLSISIS
jgi:hypothetical protein